MGTYRYTGDGVVVLVLGKLSKFLFEIKSEMIDNHVLTRCFSVSSSVVEEVISGRFNTDHSGRVNITDDTLFPVVSATIIIEVLRLIKSN